MMMNSDKNGYDFNFLKNGQHLQNIQFCYYVGLVIMLRSLEIGVSKVAKYSLKVLSAICLNCVCHILYF